MVNDELRTIVGRMVAAGESEADIAAVIQRYKEVKPKGPSTAPVANQAAQPSPGGGVLGALVDVGVGALKGVGNSVVGLGKLAHMVPGVTSAVDAIYGQGVSEAGFADANRRLAPTNTAQRIGMAGEQIAEAILPGRAIASAASTLARRAAPVLGRASGIGARAAVETGAGAGIAAMQQGDVGTSAVLGGALPVVGGMARGAARALVPKVKLSPVEEAAIEFAKRNDIPVDAGTATGSSVVRTVQKRVSDSLGGANVAEAAKSAQADALERVSETLAKASNQGAAVDAVGAGQGVRQALTRLRDSFVAKADEAYGALRQIENEQHLAVDLKPVKNAMLKPYQELLRESEVAPLMGQKAEALRALDRLMRGPDLETLSVVDSALSGLKSFARTDGALRTPGQGVIAQAVSQLDAMVQKSAMQGGSKAINALQAGRKATIAKYQVDDVLDALSEEPRLVFDQLTRRKDTGIETLKLIKAHAPQELPRVGRAYLEELFNKATAEGGFGHADALWSEWRKLGAETRGMLFGKLSTELDKFFLLAKKMAENPNPSGTAKVASIFNVLTSVPSYAVAKLMYSPQGVKVLTGAMSPGAADLSPVTAALNRIVATQAPKGQ